MVSTQNLNVIDPDSSTLRAGSRFIPYLIVYFPDFLPVEFRGFDHFLSPSFVTLPNHHHFFFVFYYSEHDLFSFSWPGHQNFEAMGEATIQLPPAVRHGLSAVKNSNVILNRPPFESEFNPFFGHGSHSFDPTLKFEWLKQTESRILVSERQFLHDYVKPMLCKTFVPPKSEIIWIVSHNVHRLTDQLAKGAKDIIDIVLPQLGHSTIRQEFARWGNNFAMYPWQWRALILKHMMGYHELPDPDPRIAQLEPTTKAAGLAQDIWWEEFRSLKEIEWDDFDPDPFVRTLLSVYRDKIAKWTASSTRTPTERDMPSSMCTSGAKRKIQDASSSSESCNCNRKQRVLPKAGCTSTDTSSGGKLSSSPSSQDYDGTSDEVLDQGRCAGKKHRSRSKKLNYALSGESEELEEKGKKKDNHYTKFCKVIKKYLDSLDSDPSDPEKLERLTEGYLPPPLDCSKSFRLHVWMENGIERLEDPDFEIKSCECTGLHPDEVRMLKVARLYPKDYRKEKIRWFIAHAMILEQDRLCPVKKGLYNTGPSQAQIVGSIDVNKSSYLRRNYTIFEWMTNDKQKDLTMYPPEFCGRLLAGLREFEERMIAEGRLKEAVVADPDIA